MRGTDQMQEAMFSYISPQKAGADGPSLAACSRNGGRGVEGDVAALCPGVRPGGRPSIAPERLLRALLLQIFYSIRSERLLMEQLDYNLLFRWFVGMEMDERVWDHAVFSKNREWLLNEEIAEGFFQRVLKIAQPYLSDEHFTVDGTLIEAWASHKSFRPKEGERSEGDGNGEVNFHGERRSNATHRSTTDLEARLYKKTKGSEAKLCYLGNGLMENRNGLLVKTRLTLAADKNYDTRDFVRRLQQMRMTPHVAQNTTNRSSAIDRSTTRLAGYALSQQKRKRVEQSFDWMKMVGMLSKVKLRGRQKVGWLFTFTAAAYNLRRLQRLKGQAVA